MNCNKINLESLVNCYNIPTQPIMEFVNEQANHLLSNWMTIERDYSSPEYSSHPLGFAISHVGLTKNYLETRNALYTKEFILNVFHHMGDVCGTTKPCIESFYDKSVEFINTNYNQQIPFDIFYNREFYCTKDIGDTLDCQLKNDPNYRTQFAAYKVMGPVLQYQQNDYGFEATVDNQYVRRMSPITAEKILQGVNLDGSSTTLSTTPYTLTMNQDAASQQPTTQSGESSLDQLWKTALIIGTAAIGLFIAKKAYNSCKKPHKE